MDHICNVKRIMIGIICATSQTQGTKLLHRSALSMKVQIRKLLASTLEQNTRAWLRSNWRLRQIKVPSIRIVSASSGRWVI